MYIILKGVSDIEKQPHPLSYLIVQAVSYYDNHAIRIWCMI